LNENKWSLAKFLQVHFGAATQDKVFSMNQLSDLEKCVDFEMLRKGILKIKNNAGIRTWKLLNTLKESNEIPSLFPNDIQPNLFDRKTPRGETEMIETYKKWRFRNDETFLVGYVPPNNGTHNKTVVVITKKFQPIDVLKGINLIADRFATNNIHLWDGQSVLQISPKPLTVTDEIQTVEIPKDLEIEKLCDPKNNWH
jgi:hypothetical protein